MKKYIIILILLATIVTFIGCSTISGLLHHEVKLDNNIGQQFELKISMVASVMAIIGLLGVTIIANGITIKGIFTSFIITGVIAFIAMQTYAKYKTFILMTVLLGSLSAAIISLFTPIGPINILDKIKIIYNKRREKL